MNRLNKIESAVFLYCRILLFLNDQFSRLFNFMAIKKADIKAKLMTGYMYNSKIAPNSINSVSTQCVCCAVMIQRIWDTPVEASTIVGL